LFIKLRKPYILCYTYTTAIAEYATGQQYDITAFHVY